MSVALTGQQIKEALTEHAKWLNGGGGSHAVLRDADLSRADLSGADLSGADLRDADLSGAVLSRADLSGAVLSRADLSGAVLSRADLRDADLRDAVLSRAVLSGAVLSRAVLSGADLSGARGLAFQIPQEGDLIAWKAVYGGIAKLRIPAEAKRTGCLINRKCRAEWVETLQIILTDGSEAQKAGGRYRYSTVYQVGEVTKPDSYDDDIRVDCTHGVHFWLSREEAESW